MAIRVEYTPYGTVGKLAQAAGEAQRNIREEGYQFQATQQAKQITANLQAQRERIAAQMKMQEDQLEQQQAQFEQNLEIETARVDAQKAAAGFQYLANQDRIRQETEQFEASMKFKEKAFQLESAMKEEEHKLVMEKGGAELDAFLEGQNLIQQNVDDWMSLGGTIPDDIYTSGLMAVRMGQTPRFSSSQTKGLTPYQIYNIESRTQKLKDDAEKKYVEEQTKPLISSEINSAKQTAKKLLEDKPFFRPGTAAYNYDMNWILNQYEQYRQTTQYMQKTDNKKDQLDALFDTEVQSAGLDLQDAVPYLNKIREGSRGYKPPRQTFTTTPFQQEEVTPQSQGFIKLPDGRYISIGQLKNIPTTLTQPTQQSSDVLTQTIDLNTVDFGKWSR